MSAQQVFSKVLLRFGNGDNWCGHRFYPNSSCHWILLGENIAQWCVCINLVCVCVCAYTHILYYVHIVCMHNSYLTVIGVHEMHGRITILLVVDLCSSLAYFMMIQPLPIAGKLPIKTLVARGNYQQIHTRKHCVYAYYIHTHAHVFMHTHTCTYSRSQKNGDASVPFRPVQTPLHPFMPAVSFPFRMHAYAWIISNWAWSFNVQKKKGQFVDSPTRIDSFILLWSSKLFWGSILPPLFDFERVLQSRLDWVWSLLSMIDRSCVANRLWSLPNAIAWIERCFFWLF